jgi:hypothetical protein
MIVRQLAGVLLLTVAGCEWLLDHSLRPVPENTDELCSDGRDNDFNGLTDCQDWGCLDQLVCCTLQDVVLFDTFDGPACSEAACEAQSCDVLQCGPDTGLWHTWPCPYPVVCDGALWPRKALPSCYAAGVLSHRSVPIGPGMALTVEVQGTPERQGSIEAAFTVHDADALPGSIDQCSSFQSVGGFVALKYVYSPEGNRLVAFAQGAEIGRSDALSSELHVGDIIVTADRRVEFRADGLLIATSEPLPETPEQARVALTGTSQTSAFASVQLRAGARCHNPRAWSLSGADVAASEVLSVDPHGTEWDADEVFQPSARENGDTIELYYTGCRWTQGTIAGCDWRSSAIGRAISTASGEFARLADPVLSYFEVPRAGLTPISIEVTSGTQGFISVGRHALPIEIDPSIVIIDHDVLTASSLLGELIGGLAALETADGRVFLWFTNAPSTTTRGSIGLAISNDGRNFTRQSAPVLEAGAPEDFDSEGVLNPDVIYDPDRRLFLMWYEGRDFYGDVAIGEAASADGVHWSKAPQNPVIDHTFGFASFGRPAVLWRSDGRARMFVEAAPAGDTRRRIYSLENAGTPSGQSP